MSERKLGQRLRNDLTLDGGSNFKLLSQQCGLALHLNQAQILDRGRRLASDRTKDIFTRPGKVMVAGTAVEIKQSQQSIRALTAQRNRNHTANCIQNKAVTTLGNFVGYIGEDEVELGVSCIANDGVRDRRPLEDGIVSLILAALQLKCLGAFAQKDKSPLCLRKPDSVLEHGAEYVVDGVGCVEALRKIKVDREHLEIALSCRVRAGSRSEEHTSE